MVGLFSNYVNVSAVMHIRSRWRKAAHLLVQQGPSGSFPMADGGDVAGVLLHHPSHYLVICNIDFTLLY